jgi:hypothetical protein
VPGLIDEHSVALIIAIKDIRGQNDGQIAVESKPRFNFPFWLENVSNRPLDVTLIEIEVHGQPIPL